MASSNGAAAAAVVVAGSTSGNNASSPPSLQPATLVTALPAEVITSPTSTCSLLASNWNSNCSNSDQNNGNNVVPQWKRELIQRRKQQQQQQGKVQQQPVIGSSNLVGSSTTSATTTTTTTTTTSTVTGVAATAAASLLRGGANAPTSLPLAASIGSNSSNCGTVTSTAVGAVSPGDSDATATPTITTAFASSFVNNNNNNQQQLHHLRVTSPTIAKDMRLETHHHQVDAAAPLSCGDADEQQQQQAQLINNGRSKCRSSVANKEVLDIVELAKMRSNANKLDIVTSAKQLEDCESDSSEELQYGPGIVHKLRSKYLNMTLREMNKNRQSVQCFRRAASLEDLLDHKDETPEKTRRYAKKNVTGAAAKVERYRNAARGNESMKRARSVETLMRYNSTPEESPQNHTSRFASNIFKQENDHIILVDRTTVKIENRLLDKDRLKPINKPKRIKPVLAETERPPPDLVKTTMRIFEGTCVKKLKPKGEVAVKVATFKTINDTFKAQNQKKLIPKPPIQPKPFVNGNSKIATSPRKIIFTRKPTAELIENQNNQEYHNDNVITEPIVQSVSSVVSKFQQIEKSCSPSSSPEPTFNKIRFSPVPSPEPSAVRAKVSSLDIKSPTTTPIPSPRTTSPKVQSPLSPKPETASKPPIYMQKPIVNSTPISSKFEPPKINSVSSELPKLDFETDKDEPAVEQVKETTLEVNNQNVEPIHEVSKVSDSPSSSGSSTVLVDSFDDSAEVVDSPRTIAKSALDNIGKAGMTVQYSFSDPPSIKSYLPRATSTSQQMEDTSFESEDVSLKLTENKNKPCSLDTQTVPATSEVVHSPVESPDKSQERLLAESYDEIIYKEDAVESKPIGAISSLSLIRSTTTTSYSQGNESKTIKSQKTESNSPPQKQIGIIRPLVSTKTQLPQQNLSNREIEKNLINRAKSIEQQPTKVVVSLKSAEEIQPVKKNNSSGGLWDSKPWNQQNNTMVFNFSNRKDVPDYIENDGLIIKRKKDKPRQSGDNSVIVSNIDNIQLTDTDSDTEYSVGPPSPCDISFCNDNVLINGRSNLSRTPRNHKHRIQFDDTATRTFEYPSEASMLLHEHQQLQHEINSSITSGNYAAASAAAAAAADVETSASGAAGGGDHLVGAVGGSSGSTTTTTTTSSGTLPSPLLGGGGLASYTPSKVDLSSEGFELGVTRATVTTLASPQSPVTMPQQQQQADQVDYLKQSQDPWGQETAADMLY